MYDNSRIIITVSLNFAGGRTSAPESSSRRSAPQPINSQGRRNIHAQQTRRSRLHSAVQWWLRRPQRAVGGGQQPPAARTRQRVGGGIQISSDFETAMRTMKLGQRISFLPFQKGFIITIRSMRGLVADMIERLPPPPTTYVLSGKGGANFHPTPSEANCRVRNLLLMHLLKQGLNLVAKKKTEVATRRESDDATFEATDFVQDSSAEEDQTAADMSDMQSLFKEVGHQYNGTGACASPSPIDPGTGVSAGVRHGPRGRLHSRQVPQGGPSLGVPSAYADEAAPIETTWTRLISRGGLNIPTDRWMAQYRAMEGTFCRHHYMEPDGLSRRPDVIANLVELLCAQHPALDARVVRRFVRLRTFIRMGYINRTRRAEAKERRSVNKKKQFCGWEGHSSDDFCGISVKRLVWRLTSKRLVRSVCGLCSEILYCGLSCGLSVFFVSNEVCFSCSNLLVITRLHLNWHV